MLPERPGQRIAALLTFLPISVVFPPGVLLTDRYSALSLPVFCNVDSSRHCCHVRLPIRCLPKSISPWGSFVLTILPRDMAYRSVGSFPSLLLSALAFLRRIGSLPAIQQKMICSLSLCWHSHRSESSTPIECRWEFNSDFSIRMVALEQGRWLSYSSTTGP